MPLAFTHALAEALAVCGLYRLAERLCRFAMSRLSTPAGRAGILTLLASIHERNDDFRAAIECYRAACDLVTDGSVEFQLALAYERQGATVEAVHYFEETLSKGIGFSENFQSDVRSRLDSLRNTGNRSSP